MPRLFVTAWPPVGLQNQIAELTVGVTEPDVRPVSAANLHITLRFLGDGSVDEMTDRLSGVRLPRATASVGDAIIRLGTRQLVIPVNGVDALAAAVSEVTADVGRRDEFEFLGHLTVARTKPNASSKLLGLAVSAKFAIEEIALVESRLRPEGAEYETVATFTTGP